MAAVLKPAGVIIGSARSVTYDRHERYTRTHYYYYLLLRFQIANLLLLLQHLTHDVHPRETGRLTTPDIPDQRIPQHPSRTLAVRHVRTEDVPERIPGSTLALAGDLAISLWLHGDGREVGFNQVPSYVDQVLLVDGDDEGVVFRDLFTFIFRATAAAAGSLCFLPRQATAGAGSLCFLPRQATAGAAAAATGSLCFLPRQATAGAGCLVSKQDNQSNSI